MPLYRFKNSNGDEVEVARTINNMDTPPTKEETELEGPWERVFNAGNITMTRGSKWNHKKPGMYAHNTRRIK